METVAADRSAAEAWVDAFAAGWANPVDADHFADHLAYTDPTPMRAAIALSPRAWPHAIRQQIAARRRPA